MIRRNAILLFILLFFICSYSYASLQYKKIDQLKGVSFILANEQIKARINIIDGQLGSELITGQKSWLAKYGSENLYYKSSGDFAVKFTWTDWRAPGKINNGENPVIFTKKDLKYKGFEINNSSKSVYELILTFVLPETGIELRLSYKMSTADFWIRKKVAVRDTGYAKHFLMKIAPIASDLKTQPGEIVKKGGFGQPIALTLGSGGGFFGLEYPASNNLITITDKGIYKLNCYQEFGFKLGKNWVSSDWVVQALVPEKSLKLWFFKYIADIRVAKLKPYTLYNSWYDLRAADYPGKETIPQKIVMNQDNVMRMIRLIKTNMIDRNGINLDAFVLDDGWDVYKSDWRVRNKQFPNGFKPISAELQKTGTALGIWFGPTGGYSARNQRLGWMRTNGYETVGDPNGRHDEMLCLGGAKYGMLLLKRVSELVGKEGVGYFKWDGIQFSCSENNHGHPVGIYSRRAILDSVIQMCDSVRKIEKGTYLNITSGTWLSPWWLRFANQIWMDGYDYAHADVPSVSKRDSAITYRDFVLYDDFKTKDLWFPIANLMTHGIIKGNLQKLGGEQEPIDKFTDNALLYFARGVSMWELYISPDLLSQAEWDAISRSIKWAKHNFSTLKNTMMIGGNPMQRESYGYIHFQGKNGILAVRNPYITQDKITVTLDPAYGIARDARNLVMEKVYPDRFISEKLFSCNDKIQITLEGYETAVYELYPIHSVNRPLIAGTKFDLVEMDDKGYLVNIYNQRSTVKILNPDVINSITIKDKIIVSPYIELPVKSRSLPVRDYRMTRFRDSNKSRINISFNLNDTVSWSQVSLLFRPEAKNRKTVFPELAIRLNEKKVTYQTEQKKGVWAWYTFSVDPGENLAELSLIGKQEDQVWHGRVECWLISRQKQQGTRVKFQLKTPSKNFKILPPSPWPKGEYKGKLKIGSLEI